MAMVRKGLPRLIEGMALSGLTLLSLLLSAHWAPPHVDGVSSATPEYGLALRSSHPTGARDSIEADRIEGRRARALAGAVQEGRGEARSVPLESPRLRLRPPRLARAEEGRLAPRFAAFLAERSPSVTFYFFDGVTMGRIGSAGELHALPLTRDEADDLGRCLMGPRGMPWAGELLFVVGDRAREDGEAAITASLARAGGRLRRERIWDGEGLASWLGLGGSRAALAVLR